MQYNGRVHKEENELEKLIRQMGELQQILKQGIEYYENNEKQLLPTGS